ncbi:MAG: SagB/ThcOx family dehydrogenase [Planctomycetota bacterium]|nr:SagB/ThcOx family dehydrogenase [Planctomycetota bacterium]MDI6787283.1 SagB/ThcOx family dehydrogenase [Planctomycetota bacterium]
MKKTFFTLIGILSLIILLGIGSRLLTTTGAQESAKKARSAEAETRRESEGRVMSEISLPPPQTTGNMPLEQAIQKRKSVRKYSSKELTLEQVSQLLWSAYGANPRKNFIARNVPSAGAIYPVTVYLVNKDGVYSYEVLSHSLKLLKKGDMRKELCAAAWGQGFIQQVPVNIVVTGDVGKCAQRYGDRAFRYTAQETGHIGQNVSLQAVCLGLSTVMVGAFDDNAVREVLSIPENQIPFYIIPVGYSAE